MAWNPVKTIKENPGAAVGAIVGGVPGAVGGYVADKTGVIKNVTDAISGLNPFRKPDLPGVDAPTAPKDVTFNRPDLEKVQVGRTPAATAGQINFTPQQVQANISEDFRNAQMGLMQQLQLQAAGQGPSVAQNQLQQGMEANIAAQQAALAGTRGGAMGQAGMARNVAQQGAQIQAQTNQQAANLRLQEQLGAQQNLAGLSQQARQGDIQTGFGQADLAQQYQNLSANVAGQQAGFDTQTNIANMGVASAENIQQSMRDQDYNGMQIQLSQLEMLAAQGNQNAAIQLQELAQTGQLGQMKADLAAWQTQQKQLGTIITAGSQVGMMGATGGFSSAAPAVAQAATPSPYGAGGYGDPTVQPTNTNSTGRLSGPV